MLKKLTSVPALVFSVFVACVALVGCIEFNQNTGIGFGGPTQPGASPTPSAQCTVQNAIASASQTAAAPGEALDLKLKIIGTQNLEILDSNPCHAQIAVEWDAPVGPCSLEGSGFDTKIRVNASATIGQTCSTKATAGGGVRSNLVNVGVQ